MRLSSKGKEGLLGAYSAVVLGCAPNSLPCLISVKGKTIRCDSINEEYITGGEWETGGLVVRFRGNDILTERDGGKSRECVTVTCSGVQLNQQGVTKSDFPPLPTLHLCQGKVSYWSHQGPCPRLRFTSLPRQTLTMSYLVALGTPMTSTSSVVQHSSAPPPRVAYLDGFMIPKGQLRIMLASNRRILGVSARSNQTVVRLDAYRLRLLGLRVLLEGRTWASGPPT